MATVQDLIKLYKHRPIIKVYIKRRLISGAYEGDWVQIDNWQAKDRIIDWGTSSVQIDQDPNVVGSFEVSGTTLIADNQDGIFNIETSDTSIWFPSTTYLNRRYTKLKIDTAYLDSDGSEVGSTTDFEGVIDQVIISENGTATLDCLSYQSIFTKYPIQDLALTGTQTAAAVITAISNQSKITDFMPYVVPSLSNNYDITDTATLDGTYWDVIQDIAFKSNSTIVLEGSVFKLVPRSAGSLVWNFKGQGSDEAQDIISILSYDDEGIGKIRVYWKEEGGATFAKSADSTLLLKYLSEPELVDLSEVASADKQGVLNALLTKWENNIPVVEFSTKFLGGLVTLLDKITLEVRGRISPLPSAGGFRWGSWTWGDGSVWGREVGGIIISSGTEWIVTQIIKDRNTWQMIIRAERV